MTRVFCTLSLLVSLTSFSQDPFILPADAENFYNRSYPVLPFRYRQSIDRFTNVPNTETNSDSIAARLKTLPAFQQLGPASLDSLALYAMIRFSTNDLATMKALHAQMKRSEAQQRTQPPAKVIREKPAAQTGDRKQIKTAEIEETLDIKLQRVVDRRTAMNSQMSLLMQRINSKSATN
jgi:hypothetical protein